MSEIEWGWAGNGPYGPYLCEGDDSYEGQQARESAESGVHDWRRDGYPDTHLVARLAGEWVRVEDGGAFPGDPLIEAIRKEAIEPVLAIDRDLREWADGWNAAMARIIEILDGKS